MSMRGTPSIGVHSLGGSGSMTTVAGTTNDALAGFACPACHAPLAPAAGKLRCASCPGEYPLREGIPSFVPENAFYEGRWAEPDPSAFAPVYLLVKKERFFWSRLRGRSGPVLDLGCGGGWRLYTRTGPVTGVDVSLGSLRSARSLYARVAQATLSSLPFADESFDFVVSSDVLGHVPLEEKDAVLAEVRRVLRTGGLTLHYVETEGDDPLMRFARGYPELYSRYVVEPEGHIGLETAAAVFQRFRRAGFKPIAERAVYRGPTYVRRIGLYFDNEYRQKSALVAGLVAASKAMCAVKPLEMAANLGISALLEVADRCFPVSWAGGALVCYQK
ncbi:MAG: methyltransferase domain-containing protein [Bacteroidetes bacterium]|nr:methyltransferase domain-containing protein [Bacteroidota bacterium]